MNMRIICIVTIVSCLGIAGVNPCAAGEPRSAAERLAAHMRMLESLRHHWREVARAVHEEKPIPDRPEQLAPDRLTEPWERRMDQVREQAEKGETGSTHWERARWLASVEANELAVAAYQAALEAGDAVRVADRRNIHSRVADALTKGEHEGLLVDDRRALAVVLFELGGYSDAHAVVKPLLDVELAPTLGSYPQTAAKDDLQSWVKAISSLTDGQPPSLESLRDGLLPVVARGLGRLSLAESAASGRLRGHFPSLTDGYRHRSTPGLLIWDCADSHERIETLRTYFYHRGDRQGQYLCSLWVAEHPETTPEGIVEAIRRSSHVALALKRNLAYDPAVTDSVVAAIARRELVRHKMALVLRYVGETAFWAGDDEHAIRLWQQAADNYFGTEAWPRVMRWLGLVLKIRGEHEQAMAQYKRLLVELPAFEVEHAARLQYEYKAAQGEAMWQIGQIHLERGESAAALEMFRTGEREYPRLSGCGNAAAAYREQYPLYQGLCLEHLGRYREATDEYWRGALDFLELNGLNTPMWLRVVHLYHAAGQLAELREKLDELKSDSVKEVFTTAIEMQLEADRSGWPALVERLSVRDPNDGPQYDWIRHREWRAVEAARLLAVQPEQTVPLLVQRLQIHDRPVPNDRMWVFYTLGLAGTPEAIAALAAVDPPGPNSRYEHALQYALWLSGEAGRSVIAKRWGEDVLKRAERGAEMDSETRFPPIPDRLSLSPQE